MTTFPGLYMKKSQNRFYSIAKGDKNMKKVRFLESCFSSNFDRVYGFNDEAELEDTQADALFDAGVVDILKDEEPEKPKRKKVAPKGDA